MDFETVFDAVELACRAPSLHNSQPWRWVAGSTTLELFADPHRVVRSSDESGREALISCGAAIDHLRVAMAAAGWKTRVDRFPDPDDREHIASMSFTALAAVDRRTRELADAILRRRTDRLPFRTPGDVRALEVVLRRLVTDDYAALDVLSDDAKPELISAARLAESLRRYDDSYHHELQWWTAPFRLSEGVPPDALVSSSERQRVPVNRNFAISGHADRRHATINDEAAIAVLSTAGDTPEDAVKCGEALSMILLECTMAGLATCTVTHVTELADSRDIVRGLTGRKDTPQVLIRIGTAPSIEDVPPPTPRRDVREVLEIRGDG